MTNILFAGGEQEDFPGQPGFSTANNFNGYPAYDSGHARASFAFSGASTSDPPSGKVDTPTFAAASTVWVHGVFSYSGTTGFGQNANNAQFLRVYSPDGVCRLLLRQTATSGGVKLSARNAAGTITDLVTGTPWSYVDGWTQTLDVEIVYGTSGLVNVWIAGKLILTYSGDVTTDGATQINQVGFAPVTGNWNSWSEIIIADGDTRGMVLWTIPPVANGNTMAWSGAVSAINGVTPNDSSPMSSAAAGDLAEFTVSTSPPTGTWNVIGLVQTVRAQAPTTGGPQHINCVARVGGTDYVNSNTLAPSTGGFSDLQQYWPTNPATSAAWLMTDIGSGFNLGFKSAT